MVRDRNWLEFLSVLDSTFAPLSLSPNETQNEEKLDLCTKNVSKTRNFLMEIAEQDGTRDRSAILALLELEKRAIACGVCTGAVFSYLEHEWNIHLC